MTIEELKQRKLILLEAISGSKAYGTDTPQSDTDIRGVFILPQEAIYGLDDVAQISDETQDITYYELGRFIELLAKNNPNILELLNVPSDCLLYKHPLMDHIKSEDFLTKQCKNTFAGYAMTQVKKARGLNKKILNPVEKARKNILHFCYVTAGQGAVPLLKWLEIKNYQQIHCGLVNIAHMRDVYALFYDDAGTYKGIMLKEKANQVALSAVPKEAHPEAYLYFNKDGYSYYCKQYKAYWDWVEERNEARYENTMQHGKHYDTKNMMHTMRLIDMAEEIALQKQVIVRRPNRDYLMQIRAGEFTYEALLDTAEKKIAQMDHLYEQSDLPEKVDLEKVNALLARMRREYYGWW